MPSGTVTYRVRQESPRFVGVEAWGDGAEELISGVPRLLGAEDDPDSFRPEDLRLRSAHRQFAGLRVPATGRVLEALVPAVLEQKVVGIDAFASWRRLVARYGEAAPGPAPPRMRVVPEAAAWLEIPSWAWHQAGVEQRRATTVRACASYAARLEAAAAREPRDDAEVYRMLQAIPGVGVWTAAQVGHRALGDADAAPIGDYHLPALLGRTLGDGRPMPEGDIVEFLEPWRPHRYRLVRLLMLMPGPHHDRRGPRMPRRNYRAI
jgi:3-methyladenine DNA glycosylase/8-oxoguanine DNA glycosylase